MRTAVTHSRFWVLAVLLALGMAACDTELVDVEPPLESPILTALEPAEAVAGDATFTLSVEGGNFTVATTVYWDGEALPTEFVSDSLVRAQVGAEDLEAAGAITVEVVDPSSSLISNQLLFEVLEPAVTGLVVTVAPHPLARYLDVTLNRSDSIEIRYRRDDGIGPTLAIRVLVDRTGRVTLARLAPDADYTVTVARVDAGSDPILVGRRFATDPLPDDLARLEFAATGTPTQPLAALEVIRNPDGFQGVVVVDAEGTVVWYAAHTTSGSTRRANGNFVLGAVGSGLLEISPDGSTVNELVTLPIRQHHDVITSPHNTIYYLTHDEQVMDADTIVGEAIWEWDPDGGTNTKLWSAWDHLSYDDDRGDRTKPSDWLHANAISIGPDGNVLMSFRFLSQVISITPDFGALEWRLGGPNSTIAAEGEAEFFGQHTAAELPTAGNRRVLMFDNGLHARGFSRALELEIDPANGTSTKVLEFVPPNQNLSFIVGLARRMENGNTFIAFGAGPNVLASKGPVEAYEVEPDGTIAWKVQVGGADVESNFVMYRAWPTGSLAGETESGS